jgi:hypothetical protein
MTRASGTGQGMVALARHPAAAGNLFSSAQRLRSL